VPHRAHRCSALGEADVLTDAREYVPTHALQPWLAAQVKAQNLQASACTQESSPAGAVTLLALTLLTLAGSQKFVGQGPKQLKFCVY